MPITNKKNFKEDEVLFPYITNLVNDAVYHKNYEDNINQASQMGVHLKGDLPEDLLTTQRPNEPTEVMNYRLSIYEPTTQSQGKRIINVLSKIQQSSNYSIKFEDQSNVDDSDSLKSYTQEDYPVFGSVEKWAFDVALKQDLIDANALVVVKPLMIPEDNVTYLKPFTFIYRSDQVLDYGLNYYTILLDEKNMVKDVALNIWEIVTDSQILRIKQTNPSNLGIVEVEVLFEFGFGEVPAYFLKGDYREETLPFAYDSFVSGILPYWNKAVRMTSDLDAQYVAHLFLERVEMEVECDNGCSKDEDNIFKVQGLRNGQEILKVCDRCSGGGFINGRSPFGTTSVRKDAFGEDSSIEFPGVTYIDKPVEIVELTEKKVAELLSSGFASINLDIIDKVGENQSGVAKTIDRDELYSFLNKISDNLFDNIIKNAFRFISLWRFSVINETTFPTINKPTSFNALNETLLVQEIESLAAAGIDTTQWELDLIDKKFPNDTQKQEFNKNVIELDYLSGKTEEEKLNVLLGGGVSREQYIISSNIRGLILDAIEKDADFLNKTREQKIMKLEEMVKAKIVSQIEIPEEDANSEGNGQSPDGEAETN